MAGRSLENTQSESIEALGHDGVTNTSIKKEPGSHPSTAGKQSAYVPQFSSTTSLILDRIKGRPGNQSNDPASTAVSVAVVTPSSKTAASPFPQAKSAQSLSDTLLMPMPVTSEAHQNSLSTHFPESVGGGAKRKRDSLHEEVDFAQSTIAFPWVDRPKSARSVSQLSEGSRNCRRCEGNVELNNVSNNLLCLACAAEQDAVKARGEGGFQRRDETESLRRKRLAAFPPGISPAEPSLVGFGAGRASSSSRTEYFATKKKMDLLNILSLCDQLKPQLLVDILVSVSKKHPDLPIFDSPDWEAQLPSTPRSGKITAIEKPRHGHTVLNGKAKLKTKATKKILKRTRVIEVIKDAPGVGIDVLPPTWLKADKGMYSELVPDTEDRGFLKDDNDEESFSHFMVDSFGNQVTEPVG